MTSHYMRRIARRERERRNDHRITTRGPLHHCGKCGCRVAAYQDICAICALEIIAAGREAA